MASSYRFECIFYRLLLNRSMATGQPNSRTQVLKQRLRASVFELDTIVSRLMVNNTLTFANLNLYVECRHISLYIALSDTRYPDWDVLPAC